MLLVLIFPFPWTRWRWGKARAKLRWREFDRVPPKDIGSASRTFTWQLCGFPSWRRNLIASNRIPTSGKGLGMVCYVSSLVCYTSTGDLWISTIASKINVTPKGVYLAISKLHSILLAHNNISQICYCGQISLQSPVVFLTIWHLWGNIYFAGDNKFCLISMNFYFTKTLRLTVFEWNTILIKEFVFLPTDCGWQLSRTPSSLPFCYNRVSK